MITGVNVLTGEREQVTRALTKNMAEELLQKANGAMKWKRQRPYKSLKIEKCEPKELDIKFEQ